VNVERRLPTPGKAPRKSIENDDLNESLSQAYATLRQQYDSLTAEMKQLRASPDKDKALKYQEVLAEKQVGS
jgi:site-specific DNA-adenine methylase